MLKATPQYSTRIAALEEDWQEAIDAANDPDATVAETDSARALSTEIAAQITQTPSASVIDVATKLHIALRDIRENRIGADVTALLESAEQDLLRLADAD